jgi:hypothetical protein
MSVNVSISCTRKSSFVIINGVSPSKNVNKLGSSDVYCGQPSVLV